VDLSIDRRISQGAKGEPPVSFISATRKHSCDLPYSKNHPADSFPGFLSELFVGADEGLFVATSLGAVAFSPAFCVAGDSFLAASLYESLR
jgi:hypothetical protein